MRPTNVALALVSLACVLFFASALFSGSSDASASLPANAVVYNSRLGNATVRAELGRSTWTLLHTMAARYPEDPLEEQQQDATTFITLLSRLYACGQCAEEFQKILAVHPPRLQSQDEFIQWACEVHNIVNKRLEKPIFDCSTVRDRWTCGCASEV